MVQSLYWFLSSFRVILQMLLALSLDCYKWYHSNLVTSCGCKVLHDTDLEEDARDLSARDYDISES
jgi:hypothetical protein